MNDDNVRSYSNAQEMFDAMATRELAAALEVVDKQREVTWGSYFFKPVTTSTETIYVFAKCDTLDDIVQGEVNAGADSDEIDYYKRHYTDMHQRNYRRGWHYSVVVPDGEYGDSHLVSIWPITEADFEEAKSLGWTPSESLLARVRHEMDEAKS